MGRLASSLLVIVDCSKLSVTAREDLFMNSRDRLSNGELRKSIEEELEELVGKHPGLRELRERRRSSEIAERLEDSKPLEQVLDSIMKSSPSLAKLFLFGQRLSRPHRTNPNGQEGGGQGDDAGQGEFRGLPHPKFFRFHRKRDDESLDRNCEIGRRCRIKFETDVENEYFSRSDNRGYYHVEVIDGPSAGVELDNSLTLHNGIANWSIHLPDDKFNIGDVITIQCTVSDDVISKPFVNLARLHIISKTMADGGERGSRQSSNSGGRDGNKGSGPEGKGGTNGSSGKERPGGIQMPRIVWVEEADYGKHQFDRYTACKIIEDGSSDDEGEQSTFSFYINADNLYLLTDMKGAKDEVKLIKEKFKYGNVLVGLALIHDYRTRPPRDSQSSEDTGGDQQTIASKVEHTTRALAPFLVPMIDYLGALGPDEVESTARVGDEE
jgi:hypothetical protein